MQHVSITQKVLPEVLVEPVFTVNDLKHVRSELLFLQIFSATLQIAKLVSSQVLRPAQRVDKLSQQPCFLQWSRIRPMELQCT